jgi:hypothetical protein
MPLLKAPDTRRIFLWRGPNDAARLADLVAETLIMELFSRDGALVELDEGQFKNVSKDAMVELIGERIASVRLTQGTSGWESEIFSFDFPVTPNDVTAPNQKSLLELMALLVERVAKAPSTPPRLTAQQQFEIRTRFREGEPAENIGRGYGIEADAVRAIGRM